MVRSMSFPETAVAKLLADCKRHCCVCWRRCGFRIELHHIQPRSEGGSDDIENAIPVCFNCHAEIESAGPRGRRFTQRKLKEHRRRWLELVASNPGVLIDAAQRQTETGPLEALHAELDFNGMALREGDLPPLAVLQFERATATNALSTLAQETRELIQRVYATSRLINYHLQAMAAMDRSGGRGGRGGAFANAQDEVGRLRGGLHGPVQQAKEALDAALGRGDRASGL